MQAARGASLNPSDPVTDDPVPPAPGRARLRWLFAAVGLTAYGLDVVTKMLAVHFLTDREPVPLLGQVLQLTLLRNPGAAFSTGTGITWAFTLLAVAGVVVVVVLARRLARSRLWAVALGLLAAGILGNLTDRLFREPGFGHGHVIDFLMLPHWPVFNVADMAINLGAALVLVQAFRGIHIDGSRERGDAAAPTPPAGRP